eukprot:CAMPEP_0197288502 /NCGR_PEP_ID=MMETSP0890-20130614/5595_1 /TAXON_ID=44058 ORGANISM="Aureoumbra lagunensis, Strain CCMP1510" /NCGR_SAMPLE_ID=MMETSP0890 /ASSEMBLY_ACC=CAM_ASM_000533 /LENGTH=289 /DNA_ID=CAMNT_0042759261 /DNA_START=38 /DNA_END=907 /DNA_ORIENTATION=+
MKIRPIISRTKATLGGPIARLVGTVDCDGSGMLHPLHDVDPFVLCDVAKIPKANMPDFGAHPHFGCIACSVVIEGGLLDRDSVTRKEFAEPSKSGDVYAASAGRGIYHEEVSACPSYMLQVIVRIPRAKLDLPPAVLKASYDQLPVTTENAKILYGTLQGKTSPATPEAWPDCFMLRLKAKDTPKLSIPDTYPHGFCFAIYGSGSVCGEPLTQNEVLVFGGNGDSLTFEADSDDFEVFVGSGLPLPEPWIKLKGNNGFGIFINDLEARDIMTQAAAAGESWNYLTPKSS